MKTTWILILGTGVALLVSGCRSLRDEAALFGRKYAKEARYYHLLEPASLEAIKFVEHSHFEAWQGLLDGVEHRKGDPDQLDKYLQRTRVKYVKIREFFQSENERIEALLKEGGKLYYYEWEKGEGDAGQEAETSGFAAGLMVIRDGKIIYTQEFYGGGTVPEPQL